MISALFSVLIAWIFISKGQGTDQEFRNYERRRHVLKGTNYFLNITSNMIPLTKTTCMYHEVYALILMNSTEENVSPSRLASIPLQELKTQSTVGIITKDTQQKFQLGKVSFLSTVNKRNNSHDELELHLKLEIMIPESVTSHPLFDEIELVVRCQNSGDVSSLGTRHEVGHYRLVYYNNTKKISPTPVKNREGLTKSPLSTGEGLILNSTGITQASQSLGLLVTPSPDPGSSEEKKNPPGEGPTLNSTGITEASQSLGLLVTPSPDPGSSEEKKNPSDEEGKKDGSLSFYFFLAALFISCVMWLTILVLSKCFRDLQKPAGEGYIFVM